MNNKRLVFIGDSITESGRLAGQGVLGTGYVLMIRDWLAIKAPDELPEVINQGRGGDRITDLVNRWQSDVIDCDPDLVSISIGVNDVWRQLDHPDLDQVYPNEFEKLYIELIEKTQRETDADIILMEPTVIEEDLSSEGNQKLKPYVKIVNDLAQEYKLIVVPTHKVFLDYLNSEKPVPLTVDGVHMTTTGDMLMAKTWLETVYK